MLVEVTVFKFRVLIVDAVACLLFAEQLYVKYTPLSLAEYLVTSVKTNLEFREQLKIIAVIIT